MDGWIKIWSDRWRDGAAGEMMDGETAEKMGRRMDERTDVGEVGLMDQQMVGRMDR